MDMVVAKKLGIRFTRRSWTHSGLPFQSLFGKRQVRFWALKDISFTLGRGDALALVGNNGSGKTTLLKLLAGVLFPDQGELTVRGRFGCLLSLGTGFVAHLSGRENIYLTGAFLGLDRKHLDRAYHEILAFAELDDWIETPIRYYSSGMRARLSFSIAVHLEPEILLLDEILSAGDRRFRARAEAAMEGLIAKSKAIVVASHNLEMVTRLCNRTLWLENGRMKAIGPVDQITADYAKA